MKTIVITGASSGIGKATAQYFHQQGWNVVATMRAPEKELELKEDARLKILQLDVQNPKSIEAAIQMAIQSFGRIDVWLNNAGYGASGPLEAGSNDQIRRQYDVNFFGLIDCIKGILPHFRANKSGTIINISSIGGLIALPMYSLYNSTKFAVEGLTESLQYELAPLGIKVKLIEPGGIRTEFLGRSSDAWNISHLSDYQPFVDTVNQQIRSDQVQKHMGTPEMVAKIIFQAATDESAKLRYLAGKDAKIFATARRFLGARIQMTGLKKFLKL